MKINYEKYDDNQLVDCYLSGDDAAYDVLLSRYEASVKMWLRVNGIQENDLDDVVQDLFAKISLKLKTTYASRRRFGGWLKITVKHCAIDLYRRKNVRQKEYLWAEERLALLNEPDLGYDEAHEKQLCLIESSIRLLQPNDRAYIQEYYYEKKTYREMAQNRGCTIGAVAKHFKIVIKRLKKIMDDMEDSSCR